MYNVVPPLSFFCISILVPFPHLLHHVHHRRIPAVPALLDAFPDTRDPRLWATLAQLVHPLPPCLHDRDIPLSHPHLPLLQKIADTPDFSLVTLVSLPNCTRLRDDDVANLRALHRLLALDLRGCSITSYALTALARGLAPGTGTWGLRLLGLHGCPNIADDVLSVLHKFPLLSAVDLRFTRCTLAAVDTLLSPLGFRPSGICSLFYPAPLSVALCTLEKVAQTASEPISLYSCPLQSVFRIHIDELNPMSPRPKKVASFGSPAVSKTPIRTASSEEVIVFFPPQKHAAPATTILASASPPPIDAPSRCDLLSNASSFYKDAPVRSRHSRSGVLSLSARAVQSSEPAKLDFLAVARSPPPWNVLDTHTPAGHQLASLDCVDDLQWNSRSTGRALDGPLKVDRARLHKRGSDSVADMVHRLASKRPKVESEFTLAKTRTVKPRNPFVKSVFADSSAKSSDKQFSKDTGHELRICRSLSSSIRETETGECLRPLRPITTFKPPILPKEFLPTSTRPGLRQTRLSFS